jgi:hypothetical protein
MRRQLTKEESSFFTSFCQMNKVIVWTKVKNKKFKPKKLGKDL